MERAENELYSRLSQTVLLLGSTTQTSMERGNKWWITVFRPTNVDKTVQSHALLFSPTAIDMIDYWLIREEHVAGIAYQQQRKWLHLPVSPTKCKFLEGTKRRTELSSNFHRSPKLLLFTSWGGFVNDAPVTSPILHWITVTAEDGMHWKSEIHLSALDIYLV